MRLNNLRKTLTEEKVDALLISQPENRRYLSGFTGSAGWLVVTAGQAILATDFRYYEQMGHEAPDFELFKIQAEFSKSLAELLAELGVERLGFESQHVTVDQFQTWSQASEKVEWLSDMDRLRLRESADRTTRFVEDLDMTRERAVVVQEELLARLSEKMDRTMYILSIVAAIFLPLGFFTGLLGVNVAGIPGTDYTGSFVILCLVLVLMVIFQIWLFKHKKWL